MKKKSKKETVLSVLKDIRKILQNNVPVVPTVAQVQKVDPKSYQNYLKEKWNMDVATPQAPDGRITITVPKGITLNKVVDKIKETRKFSMWCSDLEKEYGTGRRKEVTYSIACFDAVEGDADTKGKYTAEQAQQVGDWMNLLEWLLFSDFCYWRDGTNIDTEDWTIFPKDIDRDGDAAGGSWYPGGSYVRVGGQGVRSVVGNDRFRSVISL